MDHLAQDPLAPLAAGSDAVLYGRQQLVDTIGDSSAKLTLLSGDSGIGKSAVLMAAVQIGGEPALAPPPVLVARSPGAFQQAFLEALRQALSRLIEQHGQVQSIVEHLADAARRLVRDKASQLPAVLGKALLAAVTERLGSEATDILKEFAADVDKSYEEQLSARIAAATDQDVVSTLVAFACEVQQAAETPLLLRFDGAENLARDDLAILADLASSLPHGIYLCVAFATTSLSSRGQLDWLVAAGARDVSVEPLDHDAIVQWVGASGLTALSADRVHRLTGGYPLHVDALVAYARHGGDPESLPVSDQLAALTRLSWSELEIGVARIARLLSAFEEPLPHDRLLMFLNLDASAWGEVEDRLWGSRIFSIRVKGHRWFHELKRKLIWDSVLANDERSEVEEHAILELTTQVNVQHRTSAVMPLARLIMGSASASTDPQLTAVTRLDKNALAVLAALIELREPTALFPSVEAQAALEYARALFGALKGMPDALRALADAGLITIQTTDNHVFALAQFHNERVSAAVAGRAADVLARLPLPGTASVLFEQVVRPALGDAFTGALYGLGVVTLADLSQRRTTLLTHQSRSGVLASDDQPSLALRATYQHAPMFAVATFANAIERDEAMGRLDRLTARVLDAELAVSDVFTLPGDCLPSQRFLVAWRLLLDRRRGSALRDSALGGLEPDAPMTVDDVQRRRMDTIRAIRQLSSPLERSAMDIEEPNGCIYWGSSEEEGQDWWLTVMDIRGGRETAVRSTAPMVGARDDPFARLRWEELAELTETERISRVTYSAGHRRLSDPSLETLSELQARVALYNTGQRRRLVRLSDDELTVALTTAVHRREADAIQLADLLFGTRVPMDAARSTRIVMLVVPQLLEAFGPIVGLATAHYWVIPATGGDIGQVEVHVAAPLAVPPTHETARLQLEDHFGVVLGDATEWGDGVADSLLARFLGHTSDEIQLVAGHSLASSVRLD